MKNHSLLALLLVSLTFSCDKNDDPPTVSTTNYMSLSAGSTRTYAFTNNTPPASTSTYVLTTTNRDTVVSSRTYRVLTSSNGNSEYYAVTGSDYYVYQPIPAFGNTSLEILYLKENVGINTPWTQTTTLNIPGVPFPVTLNLSSRILEKGISKTVNNITYSNVIHVKRDITANIQGLPVTGLTTDMHYYYAPKVGLIENNIVLNLNFMGIISNNNTQTRLQSATIL